MIEAHDIAGSSANLNEQSVVVDLPVSINISFLIQILKFAKHQYKIGATFVEEHAIHICEEFKQLSAQAATQGKAIEDVVRLARTIEMDGQVVPYERSVEILYQPLAEAIANILQVSKLAMAMVMAISDAADNITLARKCIEQVQSLTRQTNMLAMNTQIEAARAGEAGRSFRIIAQEVKGLSESIKSVSQQIHDEVVHVSDSVMESARLVESLANYDMSDNLELKSRIDSLIESVMQQNNQFTQLLHESAAAANRTAHAISALVVGIQFQDRNSQIIGDMGSMLDYVIAQLEKVVAGAAVSKGAASVANIEGLIADIKLSEVRNQSLQWFAESGDLSINSELYKRYMTQKPKPQKTSVEALFDEPEDDSIELF